jgi:hypothetical protein
MANNKRYEGTRLQGGRRMVTVTSGLDTHPLSFPADFVGSDFHFTAGDFIWGYGDLAAALAYDLLSAHKEHNRLSDVILVYVWSLVLFFWLRLADSTRLTAVWCTSPYFKTFLAD